MKNLEQISLWSEIFFQNICCIFNHALIVKHEYLGKVDACGNYLQTLNLTPNSSIFAHILENHACFRDFVKQGMPRSIA